MKNFFQRKIFHFQDNFVENFLLFPLLGLKIFTLGLGLALLGFKNFHFRSEYENLVKYLF